MSRQFRAPRELAQAAAQEGGVLGHVGDDQTRGKGEKSRVGGSPHPAPAGAGWTFQSRSAHQSHPFPPLHSEGDRTAHGPRPVVGRQLPGLQQTALGVLQGAELQRLGQFDVLQKPGLGLRRLRPAGLHGLGAPHHLLRLVAEIAAVGAKSGVAAALFGGLHPVG